MKEIGAYSPDTNTHYPSWEALVEAEANGWVAVAILTEGKQTWPYIAGPFPDKKEANRVRTNLRNKWKRESWQRPDQSAKFFVRPAWKKGEL